MMPTVILRHIAMLLGVIVTVVLVMAVIVAKAILGVAILQEVIREEVDMVTPEVDTAQALRMDTVLVLHMEHIAVDMGRWNVQGFP